MRETPPQQALRQTSSWDFVRAIGVPVTFAASTLFTAGNPPQAHGQSPPQPYRAAVAPENPDTARGTVSERFASRFEAVFGEMEPNVALLDAVQFRLREQAHQKLLQQTRGIFQSMHPLPMDTEARWRGMMNPWAKRNTAESAYD